MGRNGPVSELRRGIAVNRLSAEAPTFVLAPGYTAADAGDGDMTVIGTADADVIYAGLGDKVIEAGAGNDVVIVRNSGGAGAGDAITIDGGTGADLMIGGTGSETFIVDNVDDTVEDFGGIDLIRSSVSYVLPESVENIILEGGAVGATGNGSSNMLTGNANANVLTGRNGSDTLTGGEGEDVFRDTAAGLSGDTITDFAVGDSHRHHRCRRSPTFTCSLSASTLTYSGGSLTAERRFVRHVCRQRSRRRRGAID